PPRPIIHALKDVSFRIGEGERVGIIGHNGAGKSTLLRTIGGIYPPARGRCSVEGSICSLFDISLGFEKEANGWRNIHYRSYLQGDSPADVGGKLRDLADFCEPGCFLDLALRCLSPARCGPSPASASWGSFSICRCAATRRA